MQNRLSYKYTNEIINEIEKTEKLADAAYQSFMATEDKKFYIEYMKLIEKLSELNNQI